MILFFDLDGTICDTLADLAGAVNATLEEYGFPRHEVAEYRKMVGNGLRRLLLRALPGDETEKKNGLVKMYPFLLKYYKEHLLDHTGPYPGVQEVLSKLREAGCRLYVNTNKPQQEAAGIVDSIFPGVFAGVYGQREGFPLKPDPSVVIRIAEEEGVSPAECWYIGDSDVDVETARNAGMRVIGCSWGFQGAEKLKQCGADAVICSPLQILSIIGIQGG